MTLRDARLDGAADRSYRSAGFATSVPTPARPPMWPTRDAFLILERGATEDTLWAFVEWLAARGEPSLAAIPRTGAEEYAEGG